MEALISVFMPTKDRPQWVQHAIRSVQNQTVTEWELVVYDVGDKPIDVPADPRIKYERGECRGPAADFQAALELTTGGIVTPLADDDRLPRRALQIASDAIGDREWLNGRTVLVNTQGEPLHLRGGTWDHLHETRVGNYMLGGAVYWRRTLTDRLGGFEAAFTGAADVDLYMRFINDTDPARTKQVLYIHTVHEQQDSLVNQARQADAARRAAERNHHAPERRAA